MTRFASRHLSGRSGVLRRAPGPLCPASPAFFGVSMSGFVRVRPAEQGGPCAVRHPEHGEFEVPNPAQRFLASDPLVRAYPWLFVSDELDEPVEDASARPGARRALPGRPYRAAR